MLERSGFARRAGRSPATSTARSTAPTSCSPDPRRRPGGAAAGRDACRSPCGCIGQETTGAGGFAKAHAHGAGGARHRRARSPRARRRARGSSTSRTRSASSPARCSTPATARSGSATSRSASSGCCARHARRRARSAWSSTRSASTTSPGCARCGSTATTCSPTCSAEHGDELADGVGLPRWLLDELGAVPSYYLRYFYAHDEVLAEQRTGVPRAATVAEIERELLEMYRDPSLTEKPALLEQRGGAFYSEAAVGLVASLERRTTAPCTWSTSATAARSPGSPTTTSSRCRRASAATAPSPLAQPPLAPELLGLVQHVAAYERLTAQAAVTRDEVDGPQGAARAPADRPARDRRASLLDAVLSTGAGADERAVVLAVDGGNSKTDLALVRDDGAVLALVRGGLSSPHHLGLDGCVALLQGLLDEAAAQAGSARRRRRSRDVGQVLLAGLDFPTEEHALHDGARRARLGAAASRSATTRSRCCGPAPSAAGASPSSAARASTASASGPTAATRASPRSARSAATGAAATTSGSRRCRRGRAARTAAARARGSSSAVPALLRPGARRSRAGRGDPPRRDPAAARARAPAGRVRRGRRRRGGRRARRAAGRRGRRAGRGRAAPARAARPAGRGAARRRAVPARRRRAVGRDPRRR